ncbi:MAG: sporulation transcriptional regulator SpoIIID [Clostridia bacterium]|nr:sporulation transcriptional regulator SpoIIID [Clostridia bacterium]
MSEHYEDRSERLAQYMIEESATVRSAAAHFGISKSTVHKDLTTALKHRNRALYAAVKELLEQNKAQRHFRGGEATRLKYLEQKEKQKTADTGER